MCHAEPRAGSAVSRLPQYSFGVVMSHNQLSIFILSHAQNAGQTHWQIGILCFHNMVLEAFIGCCKPGYKLRKGLNCVSNDVTNIDCGVIKTNDVLAYSKLGEAIRGFSFNWLRHWLQVMLVPLLRSFVHCILETI